MRVAKRSKPNEILYPGGKPVYFMHEVLTMERWIFWWESSSYCAQAYAWSYLIACASRRAALRRIHVCMYNIHRQSVEHVNITRWSRSLPVLVVLNCGIALELSKPSYGSYLCATRFINSALRLPPRACICGPAAELNSSEHAIAPASPQRSLHHSTLAVSTVYFSSVSIRVFQHFQNILNLFLTRIVL